MKFGDLRGILQYVPQFRGRTFVIALDGAVLASSAFSDILLDLAVLSSLNIRVVLVHGAEFQIQRLAEKRGVILTSCNGIGVTDETTMEVSLDAITRVSSDIMQKLSALKIRAASANAIHAHPAGIRKGVDFGHTGEMEKIDGESIIGFLDQDILPVISPVGYHSAAGTLRLNSDAVAMETASIIDADKMIFMVRESLDPLFEKLGGRQITSAGAETFVSSQTDQADWSISKMEHAFEAAKHGIPRTHLISIEHEDALLAELFSNAGVGVMISDESYQRFREATPGDIDELMFILRRAVDADKILRRSREELLAMLSDFILLEIDGNVVGCVAVHRGNDSSAAEIACMYVKNSHIGQGYGHLLLEEAVRKAAALGATQMFAISTQAIGFFELCGFSRKEALAEMPEARREKWETNGRNAVLLVKALD